MIEITHTQARRFLRQSLDAALPEAQWTALQAHLEACPECRAYRARMQGVEQAARRVFRQRWAGQSGPRGAVLPALRQVRQRRALARFWLLRGGLALVMFGVVAFLMLRPPAPPVAEVAATPSPALTATPTPAPQAFRGVVVYAARRDPSPGPATLGDEEADLYLLTAGPAGIETAQLTAGPADDIYPVWSPDGSWIAFLSNRDSPANPDHYDVYLISVAGTQLTRLTAEPETHFRPALSWSADGRWLAAQSVNSIGLQVYLIPTNGEPARPVSGTLNGHSPRFSPNGDHLAYIQDGANGPRLVLLDLTSGRSALAARSADRQHYLSGSFAWFPDGQALAYSVYGVEPGLRATPPLADLFAGDPPDPVGNSLLSAGLINEYPYPGLTRDGDLLYLSYDDEEPLCLGLALNFRSRPGAEYGPAFFRPQDLCLAGLPVDAGSWSQSGGWLVAAGRKLEHEGEPLDPAGPDPTRIDGIYALRYSVYVPMAYERLAGAQYLAGPPQVRPSAPAAQITPPQAAPAPLPPGRLPNGRLAGGPLPPAERMARLAGVFRDGYSSQVFHFETNPRSGGDEMKFVPSQLTNYDRPEIYHCPAVSPDGSQAAFVYTRAGYRSEVYTRPLDGTGRLAQLTAKYLRTHAPDAEWVYECPTWSPDGRWLAVVLHTADEQALQFINVAAPSKSPAPVVLYPRLVSTPPRWTADGRAVLLGTRLNPLEPAGIIRVEAGEDNRIKTLLTSDGYDVVSDLVVTHAGRALAYLALTTYPLNMRPAHAAQFELRTASLDGKDGLRVQLPWYDFTQPNSGYGWLHWSEKRDLFFLFRDGPLALEKARVFHLDGDQPQPVASLTGELRGAAFSADGEWLVYSTGQGTYGLNMDGALAGKPNPGWITNLAFEDLDW